MSGVCASWFRSVRILGVSTHTINAALMTCKTEGNVFLFLIRLFFLWISPNENASVKSTEVDRGAYHDFALLVCTKSQIVLFSPGEKTRNPSIWETENPFWSWVPPHRSHTEIAQSSRTQRDSVFVEKEIGPIVKTYQADFWAFVRVSCAVEIGNSDRNPKVYSDGCFGHNRIDLIAFSFKWQGQPRGKIQQCLNGRMADSRLTLNEARSPVSFLAISTRLLLNSSSNVPSVTKAASIWKKNKTVGEQKMVLAQSWTSTSMNTFAVSHGQEAKKQVFLLPGHCWVVSAIRFSRLNKWRFQLKVVFLSLGSSRSHLKPSHWEILQQKNQCDVINKN